MATLPRPLSRLPVLLSTVVLLGAVACFSPIKIMTEAKEGVDFTDFETYAMVFPPEAIPAVQERVEIGVAEEMESRGYRRAPLGQSDLVIVFQGSGESGVRRTIDPYPGAKCCVIEAYVEGTLLVDIFDAREGPRIWHGVAEVDVSGSDDRAKAAAEAVEILLRDFPGRAAGAR